MKQTLIDYAKNGSYDELYTPDYAITPIIPYVEKLNIKTIWECTDYGKSNITKIFRNLGYNVISTKEDFLTIDISKIDIKNTLIITNPPYSKKNKFLEMCYKLQIRFMMLLPITTLEGVFRNKLFKKNNIELIVLDKRIDFTGKKSCWFNTSWFCNGVCDKQLNFETINKEE